MLEFPSLPIAEDGMPVGISKEAHKSHECLNGAVLRAYLLQNGVNREVAKKIAVLLEPKMNEMRDGTSYKHVDVAFASVEEAWQTSDALEQHRTHIVSKMHDADICPDDIENLNYEINMLISALRSPTNHQIFQIISDSKPTADQ